MLPFYCIFTFPTAMLLAGAFYALRRAASRHPAPASEFVLFVSFTSLTAVCGFAVGKVIEFGAPGHIRDLIAIGTLVGAIIGFAEYFVWRHSLESNQGT